MDLANLILLFKLPNKARIRQNFSDPYGSGSAKLDEEQEFFTDYPSFLTGNLAFRKKENPLKNSAAAFLV